MGVNTSLSPNRVGSISTDAQGQISDLRGLGKSPVSITNDPGQITITIENGGATYAEGTIEGIITIRDIKDESFYL